MVMVSMVQQVLLLSSLLLIACRYNENVPTVYVDTGNSRINTKAGVTYCDGKVLSGIVYDLYPSGDTMYTSGYKDGRQDGISKEWYSNRKQKEIRFYKQNRKVGIHKGWFENGLPKFIYHFENDVYEGNVKEWFATGGICKDFNYKNGQEDGWQRMYWDNGKIRMNYQFINGRKYGLTGVKNCVSVWADSVGH